MIKRIFAPFCLLITVWLITGPLEAQQPGKVYRVGYLTNRSAETEKHWILAFQQRLRELGYVEGKNLVIELRRAPVGQPERLREWAAELVRLKADVIVASSDITAHIAKEVTTTVPIVFTVSADPVGTGLVDSLARPGGNVTGLSDLHFLLVTKRLEILKEVVASVSRVAVLMNPASRAYPLQLKDVQAAAPAFGLTIVSVAITGPSDLESGFTTIKKERAGAILWLPGNPAANAIRRQIINFAAKNQLPTIYTIREHVDDGGLMSYGTNFPELWRRAAGYVARILNGTKPAELPVQQPTKFEFVVNLKAAKQIGLTIPPNVLARADRVIR